MTRKCWSDEMVADGLAKTITITSKVLDGQGKWSPYRDDGMRTIHNHLAEVA